MSCPVFLHSLAVATLQPSLCTTTPVAGDRTKLFETLLFKYHHTVGVVGLGGLCWHKFGNMCEQPWNIMQEQ